MDILPVESALLYAKRHIYLDFFLSLLLFFGGIASFFLKEALRLERLLENLSSYTHPKPLKLILFDLRDLLTEVIETFKLLYPSADLVLNYKGEEFNVYSDRDKLKQVLINLLENALQAGSERGVLKVDTASPFGGR